MKSAGMLAALALASGIAGCSVSTSSFNDASTAGGEVVGSIGVPPPALPAPHPALGAFLDGPVGQRLGDADRDKAYQAEVDALSTGDRKTWRGLKGNFGYVAPAASAGADGCRSFSHTIYIGGRAQVGTGSGCPGPDGSWKITG